MDKGQKVDKPKIIYSDQEGGWSNPLVEDYFAEQGIEHYLTRNHAQFAERFIRTYQGMLYKRIDSVKGDIDRKKDPQWTEYNDDILLTYNYMLVHSSTKMTPKDAAKQSNEMTVNTTLELRAKHNRRYPPLSVGDTVHIRRKKKAGEKERTSNWGDKYLKVSSIDEELGQKYNTVEGRQYTPGEVVKID
jgi:hypothetical protein